MCRQNCPNDIQLRAHLLHPTCLLRPAASSPASALHFVPDWPSSNPVFPSSTTRSAQDLFLSTGQAREVGTRGTLSACSLSGCSDRTSKQSSVHGPPCPLFNHLCSTPPRLFHHPPQSHPRLYPSDKSPGPLPPCATSQPFLDIIQTASSRYRPLAAAAHTLPEPRLELITINLPVIVQCLGHAKASGLHSPTLSRTKQAIL